MHYYIPLIFSIYSNISRHNNSHVFFSRDIVCCLCWRKWTLSYGSLSQPGPVRIRFVVEKRAHDWFFSEYLGLPQSLLSRLCTTILFILKTTLNRGTNRRKAEIKKKVMRFRKPGKPKRSKHYQFCSFQNTYTIQVFCCLRFNSGLLTERKNVRHRNQR